MEDVLAILVKNIEVQIHHHHAVQLVVSLDKSYEAVLNNREVGAIRGFLIDSDISHACRSAYSTVLVISVDASSATGRVLRQKLLNCKFKLIDEIFAIEEIDRFSTTYWNRDSNHEFDPLHLIRTLCTTPNNLDPFDARLAAAIDFIHQNIGQTIQAKNIAQHIGLSERRLRHLFAEQIGIPLTSYILWIRVKIALREMLKPGVTLVAAAHEAGFSDHAHFTRTFRRMFGVSPSLLLKHSEFLQVFGI